MMITQTQAQKRKLYLLSAALGMFINLLAVTGSELSLRLGLLLQGVVFLWVG